MLDFNHSFCADKSKVNELFEKILREKESGASGYYGLVFDEKIVDLCTRVAKDNEWVKTLVIIGIGGSSLGVKAIDALLREDGHKEIKFLECSDPISVKNTLKDIEINQTKFLVISKSGTTLETSVLMKYAISKYDLLGVNKKNLSVITDKDSQMQSWAKQHDIENFEIQKNVGGRFCVLSVAGLMPLAICGYDIRSILSGARKFWDEFVERKHDHLMQKAIVLAQQKQNINVLFSYSMSFINFNAWYTQLWAESLGKIDIDNKKVGLTPVSLIGSIDQHSFLQLMMQGREDKSVTFLGIKKFRSDIVIPHLEYEPEFADGISMGKLLNKQMIATMKSLESQNVPLDCILMDELCEEDVGRLIFYFQILTSCVGINMNINTYDQPGVEMGKKILKEMF